MSLHSGNLEVSLREAEAARADARTSGVRAEEVTALELEIRILECSGRAAEIIPLADTAIRMAQEMGYRTMLWRLRAARCRALGQLGRTEEAERERSDAAAIIWELAATIPDASLRNGFLSNGEVTAVIAGA
jgi:hypothetical protein